MADGELGADSDARTKLMQEVAAQMEAIEGDFGDDFEIDHVITVLSIKRPQTGEEGMRVRNVTMSPLEGIGFLSVAQDVLKAMMQQG